MFSHCTGVLGGHGCIESSDDWRSCIDKVFWICGARLRAFRHVSLESVGQFEAIDRKGAHDRIRYTHTILEQTV